jgi:predicted nucleic acid-binding Zn ribbon protein
MGEKPDRRRPLEASPDQGGIPMSAVVRAFMKSLRLEETAELRPLEQDWAALAGPRWAPHTRPGPLDPAGTLTVFVDHSLWLSELQRTGQAQLLAALQGRYGKTRIRGLRLRLDPGR